jgi:hypothetical protein
MIGIELFAKQNGNILNDVKSVYPSADAVVISPFLTSKEINIA